MCNEGLEEVQNIKMFNLHCFYRKDLNLLTKLCQCPFRKKIFSHHENWKDQLGYGKYEVYFSSFNVSTDTQSLSRTRCLIKTLHSVLK